MYKEQDEIARRMISRHIPFKVFMYILGCRKQRHISCSLCCFKLLMICTEGKFNLKSGAKTFMNFRMYVSGLLWAG
jgi:hypothetical protein